MNVKTRPFNEGGARVGEWVAWSGHVWEVMMLSEDILELARVQAHREGPLTVSGIHVRERELAEAGATVITCE